MTATQRRQTIRQVLEGQNTPVSATALAKQLGVSRQIVVGDVALLRAGGVQIDATPRGYLLRQEQGSTYLIACCHTGSEALRTELYTVVDNGGVLEDIIVENPLYGDLTGRLHLASRYDADSFLEKAASQPESLLSRMTDGVHLHTLRCPDKETYERICSTLTAAGILYKKEV